MSSLLWFWSFSFCWSFSAA